MLPINYKKVWIIRFLIVDPALVFVYLLSYSPSFILYAKNFLRILLIIGQVGIIIMITIADASEEAYWAYYAGLILIILWSGFIFRFKLFETILFFITTVLLYNIVAVFIQKIALQNIHSREFAWFLGNNFFLISASILAIVGAYYLERYKDELSKENEKYIKAKEKAQESDRLKSSFLANLSHELRTPLNGILGFSKLLAKPNLTEEKKEIYLNTITKSGQQFLRIFDDIMEVSHIETDQLSIVKQPLSINSLLSDIYEQLKISAESKNIDLKITKTVSLDNDVIYSDSFKLKKVLFNLVENAIKFTQKGYVNMGCQLIDEQIQFFVEDSGIGISPQFANKIFDPFSQVETGFTREFDGVGLGLTIAKQFIELLKGKIWFDSEINVGTTFYFTLPVNN